MAVKIRLARGGRTHAPYYYIVVADSRSPRDGRFIEEVGTYNPLLSVNHPDRVRLKTERIAYWLSVGAQATDRVARFLDKAGLLKRTASNNPQKAVQGKKRATRAASKAEKAAAVAA